MSSNNRIERVAIVGAGGRIGKAFADALIATGQHTVTAITREGSNSTPVPGTKVVTVDYSNDESIISALQGQQFLIITLSVRAPEGLHTRIVTAAAKAGVSYIMPNIFGGDPWSPDTRDRELLARFYTDRMNDIRSVNPGTSYIVLVCGQWYEWSLALGKPWFGFDIRKREVTFFDEGTTRINTSTWDQCGRALASLLSLPESGASPCLADWKNKPLYISSFDVSQRDMLDSLHRVLGTSDTDWKIDHENSRERYWRGMKEMKEGNVTGFATALYARAFYPPENDEEVQWRKDLANGILGLPDEGLDSVTKRTVEMVEGGWVEETFRSLSS